MSHIYTQDTPVPPTHHHHPTHSDNYSTHFAVGLFFTTLFVCLRREKL